MANVIDVIYSNDSEFRQYRIICQPATQRPSSIQPVISGASATWASIAAGPQYSTGEWRTHLSGRQLINPSVVQHQGNACCDVMKRNLFGTESALISTPSTNLSVEEQLVVVMGNATTTYPEIVCDDDETL